MQPKKNEDGEEEEPEFAILNPSGDLDEDRRNTGNNSDHENLFWINESNFNNN